MNAGCLFTVLTVNGVGIPGTQLRLRVGLQVRNFLCSKPMSCSSNVFFLLLLGGSSAAVASSMVSLVVQSALKTEPGFLGSFLHCR